MISKGRFCYLRKLYHARLQRTRFIVSMRQGYASSYAQDPERVEQLIQKTADSIDWDTVITVWPNGDVVKKAKASYFTIQRGKHRQPIKEGEKAFKLYQIDNLQGQSRPLTTEELEDQKKFSGYLDALGRPNVA